MSDSTPQTPRALRVVAAIGAVLVACFIGGALIGEGGVARHEKLREELRQVEAMNRDLARDNAKLDREVKALKSDEAYIEHVIRDELGWVAPDEMVLIFPKQDDAP